jgi:processing peptidase subunit beta
MLGKIFKVSSALTISPDIIPISTSLLFVFPPCFTSRIKFDSDNMAHVALAYQSASWTSEYAFPLMLMQTILGSYDRAAGLGRNVASKMCQEIGEAELAHNVSTFNTCYKDTGLFGVYMVAPDNKLDDLMWTVCNNLVRLVHNVSDEEMERAKTNLKATMLMGLDGNSNIAEDIGRQILTYGRRMTPAEIFSRIDSITAADIKATAAKFINDQDHALAAVGGIHELPDYNWIRRHSYWLRF